MRRVHSMMEKEEDDDPEEEDMAFIVIGRSLINWMFFAHCMCGRWWRWRRKYVTILKGVWMGVGTVQVFEQ
jgi:hypothetical protein